MVFNSFYKALYVITLDYWAFKRNLFSFYYIVFASSLSVNLQHSALEQPSPTSSADPSPLGTKEPDIGPTQRLGNLMFMSRAQTLQANRLGSNPFSTTAYSLFCLVCII